jgi:hypothetical protein
MPDDRPIESEARAYIKLHSIGELMEELAAAVILDLPENLPDFLTRLLAFRLLERGRAACYGTP